jgi:type I restriction enzyme S subunit
MNWFELELGDVLTIKHGWSFKGEYFTDHGKYVLLTPGNAWESGGLKLKGDSEKYYSGDFPEEFLLKQGDMLVVMTDLKQTAPILGGAFIIPEDDRFLHNQRLGLITITHPEIVDKAFLYYVFNSPIFRAQIRGSATGATVRHTAPERIYKCKVPCPSDINTQRRISSILSAYDDLIENNNRRIALLEESMQLLYREWFVRLSFPGHEHVRVVDGLPEGWEKTTIDQAFTILGGGTPSKGVQAYWQDGEINWFTPTDLTKAQAMFAEESISKITADGLANSSAKMFPPYSIMMTSRATIGAIAINTTEACTNQGFIACLPTERVPLYFLFYWLKDHVDVFISHATGATFKEITKGVFRQLPIILPDQGTLLKYEETVKPMSECVLNLQRQNKRLSEARDLLLPRLMSGEIDVS